MARVGIVAETVKARLGNQGKRSGVGNEGKFTRGTMCDCKTFNPSQKLMERWYKSYTQIPTRKVIGRCTFQREKSLFP